MRRDRSNWCALLDSATEGRCGVPDGMDRLYRHYRRQAQEIRPENLAMVGDN
jgi:hypothetical protein